MADASSSNLVATLVTVIIGGLIGLAGGYIGPALVERRKERADKANKRADKFEDLVGALYEFDHWLDHVRQIDAYGKDIPSLPSPFAKLQAISAVYFPMFDDAIGKLDKAAFGYRLWMAQAGQKRLANQADAMREGFVDAYQPYMEKRDALLTALKEFAAREFQ